MIKKVNVFVKIKNSQNCLKITENKHVQKTNFHQTGLAKEL